jgi:hypothetical protein
MRDCILESYIIHNRAFTNFSITEPPKFHTLMYDSFIPRSLAPRPIFLCMAQNGKQLPSQVTHFPIQ